MNDSPPHLAERIANLETNAERCAWGVVFGLAIEVVLALGISHSPSVDKWGAVGTDILISLGVAGEILFSRQARSASEILQRQSDEHVAEANARAAEANAQAATAALRLEELRQRVGARSFDRPKFLAQLKDKRAAELVRIEFDKRAPDGWGTGVQLYDLLREAKWNVQEPVPIADGSPFWECLPRFMEWTGGRVTGAGAGIVVLFPPGTIGSAEDEARLALTNALAHGLNNGLGGQDAPTVPRGQLVLLIFARA